MMTQRKGLLVLPLILLTGAVTLAPLAADPPTMQIFVYGTHENGQIRYHYEVQNNSSDGISFFQIGYMNPRNEGFREAEVKRDPNTGEVMPELSEGQPDILNPQTGKYEFNPASTIQPNGWAPSIGGIEETEGFFLQWAVNDDPITNDPVVPDIGRGERLTGFSVLVPKRDDAYVVGHFDSDITARLTPMDTIEPALTVRTSPSTVSKASGATIKVQAILTISDDYDPKPDIKLESITASVPVSPSEYKDAKYGTDDRLHILPVKKDPTGKPVVYTITYSAMDGTGNKATRSATVTLNP